jgi:hypothetical protein
MSLIKKKYDIDEAGVKHQAMKMYEIVVLETPLHTFYLVSIMLQLLYL